jgi:hypothetical protein
MLLGNTHRKINAFSRAERGPHILEGRTKRAGRVSCRDSQYASYGSASLGCIKKS